MVWYEVLAGHSAPKIASSFHVAIAKEWSIASFIYWANNCIAQNKNWSETNVQDVTIKCFEPGHTFMSTDSVHAGVEKEIRKTPNGNIYDFQDFCGYHETIKLW